MNLKDYLIYLKTSAKTIINTSLLIAIILLGTDSVFAQSRGLSPKTDAGDTAKFVMKKSAWGAVLRSAVIPGWGQIYNESYVKVPVIWGFLGYFIYEWKNNNDSYKNYRDLYSASLVDNPLSPNSSYLNAREFYRDQRDLFAVFIGLVYLLNLVDSYVDAQLFDFDVRQNQFGPGTNVSLKIRF